MDDVSDEFFLDGSDGINDEPGAPVPPFVVQTRDPELAAAGATKRAANTPQFPTRNPRRGPEPCYFDIETVGDDSRAHLFNLDPLPPIPEEDDIAKMPDPEGVVAKTVDDAKKALDKLNCPPGAWLDQVADAERTKGKGGNRAGVFDAIEKARGKRQSVVALHDERRKLLATTPEFCRIVSLAWAVGNGEPIAAVVGRDANGETVTEQDILKAFWALAYQHSPLICFNGLHFDLPVIFVRSAILGVPASRMLDLKPWGKDVLDVYAVRFPKARASGDGKPRKLKALAPLYGIEVPAGDVDGSQVEELFKNDPAKLAAYNMSDVATTRAFYKSLAGYFWA